MNIQTTTQEQLNRLTEFRQKLYDQFLTARQDAQFELIDALLTKGKVASQELDAFARTMAHDLKSPLTLMISYADLLKSNLANSETFPAASLELLAQIEQGGQQGVRVIDNLLLLAWVRKGEVELKSVEMGGVINQVLHSLEGTIKAYQTELILPSSWPAALGYEPWLEEVWANYLSNGLKYGGHPPCLELGATLQTNGMIRFWVQDNGPGIAPEDQKNLFTEFTRLDKVYTEGYGLGLSTVRRIIEKLGGEAGVESKGVPGEGSLFYFTLPGARMDGAADT